VEALPRSRPSGGRGTDALVPVERPHPLVKRP
jgi:hypothetical protein